MSEAPVVQTAETVPPVAPPPAVEDAMSPKLGLLARKEKAIVEKQRAIQQKEAEMSKRMAEWEAKERAWADREKLWKDTPEKALEEFGHTYQSLTERVLAGGELTAADVEKRAMAKVKELEDRLENEKKAALEAEKARAEKESQETIQQYREDLAAFVTNKAEEYKLCALFDKEAELIYDTVDTYFQQNGKILSHDEAAGLVEKYFRKLVEEANGALTPKQQAAAEAALDKDKPQQQVRALSNGMSQTAPSFLPAKTEDDRMKRAMAALDGKK